MVWVAGCDARQPAFHVNKARHRERSAEAAARETQVMDYGRPLCVPRHAPEGKMHGAVPHSNVKKPSRSQEPPGLCQSRHRMFQQIEHVPEGDDVECARLKGHLLHPGSKHGKGRPLPRNTSQRFTHLQCDDAPAVSADELGKRSRSSAAVQDRPKLAVGLEAPKARQEQTMPRLVNLAQPRSLQALLEDNAPGVCAEHQAAYSTAP